ncbi:hypothetical protein [Chitinophaga cymbidii]|uniref:hypothetical protein n=1 Tax=Chitinophaga cymbidii TaxID=1096750 RepID=UPI0011BDE2EF|nr:hypothetical protein [Chitinophaga cymbidii]
MKTLLVFLSIFLSLFAPKMGLVDFSLLGTFSACILLALSNDIKIPILYVQLATLTLLVLSYSIIVYAFYNGLDAQIIQRNVRAFVSLIFLGLAFYNSKCNSKMIINCIKVSIMLHSFVILAQILFPAIQSIMAPWVGYTKTIFILRAFGLTNGFDTAGYFCIIGIIISYWSLIRKKDFWQNYLLLLICALASFFTSRNVMIITILFVLAITTWMLFNRSRMVKATGLFNIIAGAYIFYYFVGPLIISSIPSLEQYSSLFGTSVEFNIEESFSKGSADTLSNMFILPSSLKSLFGAGYNNPDSDVGYVKIIYMIGILGLLIIIFIHLLVFLKVFQIRRLTLQAVKRNRGCNIYSRLNDSLVLSDTIITFFVLLPWLNVKGLYLFSRGFHEFVIIIVFTILSCLRIDSSPSKNEEEIIFS